MAIKRSLKLKEQSFDAEMNPMVEKKLDKKQEALMTIGWILLLMGGLAHMLPTQMEPLLKWSMWNVSVQMVVGVLSVIAALYYLLGE